MVDRSIKQDHQRVRLKRFAIQYSSRLFVIEYYRDDKVFRKNIRIKKKNVDINDVGRLVDKIISLNKNILGSHLANREQIQDLITLLVTCSDTETSIVENGGKKKDSVNAADSSTTATVFNTIGTSTIEGVDEKSPLKEKEINEDSSLERLLFGKVGTDKGTNAAATSVDGNTASTVGTGTVMFGPNSQNHDYEYGEDDTTKESDVNIPEDLNKASDDVLNIAKAKMDVKFEENRLRPGDEGFIWDKQIDFDPPNEVSEWDDDD